MTVRLDELGILTDEELAGTLGVTTETLMTWRRDGRGPQWVKLGKSVFYRVSRIREWIAKCEGSANAEETAWTGDTRQNS